MKPKASLVLKVVCLAPVFGLGFLLYALTS